jgi:hypothetical protein
MQTNDSITNIDEIIKTYITRKKYYAEIPGESPIGEWGEYLKLDISKMIEEIIGEYEELPMKQFKFKCEEIQQRNKLKEEQGLRAIKMGFEIGNEQQ